MNIPLRHYFGLLLTYLRPQKGQFFALAVLLLAGIALQIIIPQITRSFIDAAQSGAAVEQLTFAALGFIAVAVFQQVMTAVTTYFSENVAWSATNALRADLARHCLQLDMTFHNNRTVGEIIERIDGDVNQLAEFFSRIVVVVIGNLVLVAGIVVVLLREDWRMGVGFAVFALLALVALASVRNLAIPFEKARQQANAALFGYLEERLVATEDIRANGAVAPMISGLYPMQGEILERRKQASLRLWVIASVSGMVTTVGYCVAFVAGYSLFQAESITAGTAFLILNYAILLNRPLSELTAQIDRLQSIGASVQRVEEWLQIESKIRDGAGTTALPTGALGLEFADVSFGYQASELVLNHLSFSLAPGQVLGVLGRTGSGKTTLSRLAVRLYDADAGRIQLGGVNVQDLKLTELREHTAMVTQDVQLFEANVRDNLTFFDASVPDGHIQAVLDTLELTDWLAGLADGLNTQVEAGGRNLSAGEAQLVAFARVFLRNPGLVILDEASARLDPATEQRLERAVDRLLQDRTGIIIAHRLRTVQRADLILILENGQMVEFGERERLAADPNSRFAHLLRTGLEEVLA